MGTRIPHSILVYDSLAIEIQIQCNCSVTLLGLPSNETSKKYTICHFVFHTISSTLLNTQTRNGRVSRQVK